MTDFIATHRERLLPLRAQADLRNAWLRERLDTLLPELMQRAGLDAWVVAAREYNEDPVIMTLLPEPAMAARRRAILLFSRRADGSVDSGRASAARPLWLRRLLRPRLGARHRRGPVRLSGAPAARARPAADRDQLV
jgi:hypothetical protein